MKGSTQNTKRRRRRGYTLVEIMVSAAISILVVGVSARLLIYTVKREIAIKQNLEMKAQGELFTGYLSKDVRMAAEINALGSDGFDMTVLNLRNGDAAEVAIRYTFKGSREDFRLERSQDQATQTLLDGVTYYDIRYLDADRERTAERDKVRYIQIALELERESGDAVFTRALISPPVLMRNAQALN